MAPESVREAMLSGKAVIGAISHGPNGWGIPIRAPVIRDGKVVYVLSLAIGTEALNTVLTDIKVPAGWVGTVIDREGSIVARNRGIHEWIGQSVSAAALKKLSRGGGIFYGHTKEGFDTIGALESLPDIGWAVIIGLPLSIYNLPFDETRNFIVVSALIAVFLTTAFIVLLVREIKRRYAQATLLEQKFRLEALGELTGRVAHDFNNLLFVIMGSVETLQKSGSSPRLEAIRGAAERGVRLTSDLLTFSRGGSAEPTVVELNEHVQRLVESSRERFPRNVRISFDWEKLNLLCVKVDPVQFDLAVLNILVNSCGAMPSGGHIEVITRKEQQWISLTIRDTGTGIPKDVLPRIFDPFFTTKGTNGTGFGLSQVYGFVKQANGTISVESKETGTAIRMKFPAVETRDHKTPPSKPPQLHRAPSGST
jgi:signal transduction histidine kinase